MLIERFEMIDEFPAAYMSEEELIYDYGKLGVEFLFEDSIKLLFVGLFQFLRDLLCGVEDGYDVLADPSKTAVNFKTDLHELRCCLPMIGVDGCVGWCGYEIYPNGLKVNFSFIYCNIVCFLIFFYSR
uniref:Uncharacterized protein n=1 Tax=Parascaris equorum TaxID=6256 RepID=A0A914RMR9_PAREQ